jgi:peptidoglycan LD-endopeptidase CwlK
MLASGVQIADRNLPVLCRLIHCGNRYKVPYKKGGTRSVDLFIKKALQRQRRELMLKMEPAMADDGVIVDSDLEFPRAVEGTAAPREILESLCLIDIPYCDFDGRRHRGQLVVHRDLAAELQEIFALMGQWRFPVAGAAPVVRFGWSDEASMAADNSSAFNYRVIAGTDRLSLHAVGRAVDINPRENPAIYPDGRIAPEGAVWRPGKPGTFTEDHSVVEAFRKKGWRWGGHFTHIRDYHHFEKAETGRIARGGRL